MKNAVRVKKICKAALLVAVALVPSLIAQRALRSTIALATLSSGVAMALKFSVTVERSLTSGLHFYPPPRNLVDRKGAARNLKTVEQGRRF